MSAGGDHARDERDDVEPGDTPGGIESLFSSAARVGRVPRTASEYAQLDRGRFAYLARTRELLDAWYQRLDAPARRSIRPRFVSRLRDQHLGAFFELYMHELTRCGGFDTVDVDIGREDPGHVAPDLVVHRGDDAVALEVTVCLGDDVVDPRERPRLGQLYEAVERISHRDFLIYITVHSIGADSPGRRNITRFLDRWLADLDPDEERARAARGEPAASTTIEWRGWRIEFQATGLRPELRAEAGETVIGDTIEGVGGHTHRIVGQRTIEFDGPRPLRDESLLTRALRDKAGHGYHSEDRPLVIAVMCAGNFVEDREIAQALLGPIRYRLGGGGEYLPGGLWRGHDGWRNTRVSAVMTLAGLSPISVARVEPTLWLNPAAAHPLPADLYPWRTMEIQPDGQIRERAATQPVAEMLGLSRSFPGCVSTSRS